MGRFIGSFMDDNEFDRPDLNKCPDCECYFPQDNCPLCGKECPPEMRAGNRKPVKKKSSRNGRSTAVQYVDWYHKWWFIILMLFMFPILGIILLASSPHSKKLKITVIVVALIYTIVSFFGVGNIIGAFTAMFEKPVDTSLGYEEYTAKCSELSAEEYYRQPDNYKKKFVEIELTVKEAFTDYDGYYGKRKYNDYYLCYGKDENGNEFNILVRNCAQSGVKNLTSGDRVTVYGECAGSVEIYDLKYELRAGPCVNAAYFDLMQ